MLKKCRKLLAVLLAVCISCSGMSISAAAEEPPADPGGGAPAGMNDGPLVDLDMESMNDGAIINKADNQAYQVAGNPAALEEGKEGHGQALRLDGSTNYINLGQDYQFTTGQLTIAAWVKLDASPNGLNRITGRGRTAVSGEKELGLYVRGNGKMEALCPDYTETQEGAVPFDSWQHLAVTNDGTTQTLYINGEAAGSSEVPGPTDEWNLDLLVGTCWNMEGTEGFQQHMFKGLLDDVKLYNRSLSVDEIKALADIVAPAADDLLVDLDMEAVDQNTVTNQADGKTYDVLGDAPTWEASKDGHGQALRFDGNTNYINLGQDYQFTTGQLTISAWVNIDPSPNGLSRITGRARTAVPDEKELGLRIRNNGKLEAECPGYTETGAGTVALGSWQHVAVTNDGTAQTLYINGEAAAVTQTPGPADEWDLGLLVGTCWNEKGDGPFQPHMFKGLMDDLKLYNRSLSAEEINDLADGTGTGGGDEGDVTLPDPLYKFAMDEIIDGSGENSGKKVIINDMDHTEYPIYGTCEVDDFGIFDKSIRFDGQTAYADVGNPAVSTEYTFSAWAFLEKGAANNLNKIFGRDRTTVGEHSFYIAVRGDSGREGTIDCALDGTGVSAPAGTFTFGDWTNITVTGNKQKACLYINGRLISTGGGTTTDLSTNPVNLLIGCGYNAEGTGIFNGHAFKGRLDDVRIYDKALTQEQVEAATIGIKDKLPPEVNTVEPKEGSLISPEGRIQITYNMGLAMGTEPIQIYDGEGNPVATETALEEQDDTVDGTETLVVKSMEKLVPGSSYTYKIPAGAVVNEKGIANLAVEYTYSVAQDLEGGAAESGMDYWAAGKISIPSDIQEQDGKVTISNGLVKRVFDINQNFLTVDYQNLYTGISMLDKGNLQADIRMALNDQYVDKDTASDTLFDVGGTDETIPTFQYESYQVEDSTKEPFHWEFDERISPPSMKNTPWPAKGKALIVNFTAPESADAKFAGVKVQVRYEIYDGLPAMSKVVNVTNTGENDVVVHRMSTEVLPAPRSLQDALYMDSNMNMGNDNHDRNNGQYIFKQWEDVDEANGLIISSYAVDAENNSAKMGKYDFENFGPNYRLKNAETFESHQLYELFRSSSYFEWQTLEVKKMYRVLFPQTLDAPLIYHLISSNPDTVRWGIDQAANAGFNMVLMSFGSGANVEDISQGNIDKFKALTEYAHSKDILLGAYVMQAARGDQSESNEDGTWGKMRCMNGPEAHNTLENTLKFIDATNFDCLEVDGPFPGAICTHSDHTGHEGAEDSVVKQWEYAIRDFYRELRARNVYINSPDWNFLAGANMAVMGYAEPGFNVPHAAQLIYGRQMSYYGTFEKTPAMGWTLVPLSPYGGGGDSSFWPYNERIESYDFMVGMNMMSGVIGSYRGGNGLYQEEEGKFSPSENVIETWGRFYNKYRDILGADIIHIAPPVPVDIESMNTTAIDGFVHASPEYEQKGLAAFFNQTGGTVTQKVKIPLYFTGLTDRTSAPAPMEGSHYRLTPPTRTSGPIGHMGANYQDKTPPVPEIPEVNAVPTDKKAFVCIGDMNGKEYTIDSNGDIEIELTMEPSTYTWLTIYDPEQVPSDVTDVSIPAPKNLGISAISSSEVTLTWDAVQMDGMNVKEYHIYRNGEYIGKTFTNQYTDKTLESEKDYDFEVAAVHNTVNGEKSAVKVSTVPDTAGPVIEKSIPVSSTRVQVEFNESVTRETANDVNNYTITSAAGRTKASANTVTKAELSSDNRTVMLTLANPLEPFVETIISIKNVKDLMGNVIIPAQTKVTFGPLREFKFEEESGKTAVDSTYGRDGAIAGDTVERKPGVSGNGLSFDGRNNYVDVGEIVKDLNEYSISGWFKPEDTNRIQSLVSQMRDTYDGWRYNLTVEKGELKFVANNGDGSYPGHDSQTEIAVELVSGGKKVTANQWNHFAVVRDGDKFVLYLNGEPVAFDTKAGVDQSQSPYMMWIGGCRNNAGGEAMSSFKGMMDEILFYSTSLSDQKVKELYEKNKPAEFDKSALTGLIAQAKAIQKGNYTDDSYNALQTAIRQAEAAAGRITTADELNAEVGRLQAAIDALTEKKEPAVVDKSKLQKLYEENKDKKQGSYTGESWNLFRDKLEQAQLVLNDKNATQKSVDDAHKALSEAIDKLRTAQTAVDKTQLKALYDQHKDKKQGNYTDESWKQFVTARDAALNILNKTAATQQEVDTAKTALDTAIQGLKDRTSSPSGDSNGSGGGGQSSDDSASTAKGASTGDSANTIVWLLLVLLAVGAVTAQILYRRRRKC
ncbi:LamG-like jellyroll fold domain-containing protein [Diplocloster hominis]|uniref:LamG-like jellyroll fold domain-containing protein n=1 Tax=Diplocloster hominis TaxID=3079010 RepID=UPI0031BA0A11